MSELALQVIAENKAARARGEVATTLDLGRCGLTELPPEIKEVPWVEELILSNYWWIYDPIQQSYYQNESKNNGINNQLITLNRIEILPHLTKLILTGCQEITDFGPLENLKNLRSLDFSDMGISDLTVIQNLKKIEFLDCSRNQITSLEPINKLINLTYLYCYNNQISTLKPISKLINLTNLNCYNNQISSLEPINKLINLTNLNCNENQIFSLEPIKNLTNLTNLYCYNNQIGSLEPINKLINLTNLDCFDNQITSLEPINKLINLKKLYSDSNQIGSLEPIKNLTNLTNLFCGDNQITSLEPIKNLTNLTNLDCVNNQIFSLEPIKNLTNLTNLDCGDSQITSLEPIRKLIKLTSLNFSRNPISNLAPIAALKNLTYVGCHNTSINDLRPLISLVNKDIPVIWRTHFAHGEITVGNCPLICPPVEFAMEGPEAVVEYFDQLAEDDGPLNEIKVIVLGEGASGKTSLIKRVRGEDFDAKESQTHGIRIRKTDFEVEDDTISAHIWDFGGQEVMHATHQFFLSQRCIYVLVLNSRTDEKAEYWLKHASSFGGDSPVLVVLNKMDENPAYEVDRKHLKNKYPQIKDFFKVSCKENKGVTEFKTALEALVAESPTRQTPFPEAWRGVKDHFSEMKEDYIESSVYHKFCATKGIEKPFSQEVLLQFLHDLGVVVNFKNLQNFDTQILNPLWLTNGVYRIINSPIVTENNGLMKDQELDQVINDPRYKKGNTTEKAFRYPKNKLEYIARVMEEFELCSRIDPHTYMIPQLLPVEEPAFEFSGSVIRFIVDFPEFLPDSIFPRLMVKLNDYIKDDLRWRAGMVLHKPLIFNAQARVRADKEDKKISIDICGEEPRRFLSYIRATIKEIIDDFTNLEFLEQVPIPGTKDEFMEYAYLTEAEEAGETEVFSRQLKARIPISTLLDGIEEPIMRAPVTHIPVKAFVVYAKEDYEHLKALRKALRPMERLEELRIWDEREITLGTDRAKEYLRELEEADIVLCLLSTDFIASEFCYSEVLTKALEAHHKKEKAIVPVRLRACDWERLPIGKLQATPAGNLPFIDSAPNLDEAWLGLVNDLEPLVKSIKQAKLARKKHHPGEEEPF